MSVVYCATFLPLHRAFPLNHTLGLDQLRARDSVRHARLLQSFVGGVVDFSVQGSPDPYLVGCSTFQSGDLTKTEKAVDGIFGFGQGGLSVVSQLSSHGITPRVFSHCLKGEGSGGGILVLGEILEPGIVYSPLVPSQSHYNLNLQSIAVNGQLLSIDPAAFATSNDRGTIVDSGTTLAYLVEEAYNPFVSAQNGAPLWCIGFQKAQAGLSILGDLVLKDKIFVYDLAHQRIGWANYDCSLSVTVSVTSSKDFINAGQWSVSSSSRDMLLKLLPPSIMALLMHILALMSLQIL
ncbi:hypothetical protein GH714_038780 [Hevea brasiliensis]|uniref:Peptidase A1 domain-containing protein n=1 Tax=Hevea brasiliensis TaxID=3981 RepID=A0A6A6KNG2_HEVBR|nr:hypothetical protein GH714_038780 [Hevea brasiliensis]